MKLRIAQWEWQKNQNNTLGKRYDYKGFGREDRNQWKQFE